ncbi:histidine phosphatase family protein [Cumulibacter manganitolerans]|uniref:histidine phosphatase family protein n=1 Tax=Cumulibacter manganitolerans TaxID=1884992 RepID=UPI0012976F4F|nr:histidine phosphatase family protein [Cumulibacter manganitolerans]
MTVERLLLWRHGRTEWNASGRFQGQYDTMLDATGIAQAREAAPYLAAEAPTAIYASDLSRALTTAQALADLVGLPVHADPRLRETSLGDWEGLDRAGVQQRFPTQFADWTSGRRANPGNGETALDVAARANELVAEIEHAGSGTVVLAAHGGSLKALTASLIGIPPQLWSLLAPLRNCHWSELRRTSGGQWRLHGHNIYPLSDPRTLTREELNVDSDAGDSQIGTPRPSATDSLH